MPSDRPNGPVPVAWIAGCTAAHQRVHSVAEHLTDDETRQSTLLEGWSVGHLLTHLARNADSHRGMLEAAQRGEICAQYPGGPVQRNADIERGAGRSAAELAADLVDADQRLEHAWSMANERAWRTGIGLRRQGPATMAEFVFLRWREVEVHLVDLALPERGSPDWTRMSPAYVDAELQEQYRTLAARIPESVTVILAPGDRPSRSFGHGDEHTVIEAHPGVILGWLFGRTGEPSWPQLLPWE